jgi:hypothetical protein
LNISLDISYLLHIDISTDRRIVGADRYDGVILSAIDCAGFGEKNIFVRKYTPMNSPGWTAIVCGSGPLLTSLIGAGYLLARSHGRPLPLIGTIVTLTGGFLMYYWGHWMVHSVDCLKTLPFIRQHLEYHHQYPRQDRSAWKDMFFEGLFDGLGILWAPVSSMLGLSWLIIPEVVCLLVLSYTTIHLLEYTWWGDSRIHRLHHLAWDERRIANLSPDLMDHVFGTSADGIPEDTWSHVPYVWSVAGMILVVSHLVWCRVGK